MSLTIMAHQSRKLIKFGSAGLLLFSVGWMLVTAGVKAYLAANPPYTPPDVKFGMLPKTIFPEKKYDKKSFTAQLPNDSFPKFKDQAKVFMVTRPDNTFLALEQDTKSAKDLGFLNKPTEVRYGVYQFFNDSLNQTLVMNVLDGSFQLRYPYESDQLLLNPSKMPTQDEAWKLAKDYLSRANKFPKDMDETVKKISFWKFGFDGLKSVSALADANIIRVDFFRKTLDSDLKLVSADINSAAISVLISGAETDSKKIVEVNYKYVNVDREIFSTYPIKTIDQAWEELKNGQYWPASDTQGDSMAIRKVYLAYFEPVTLTNYLQPVYVFEGDQGFVALVPAVTSKYISDK